MTIDDILTKDNLTFKNDFFEQQKKLRILVDAIKLGGNSLLLCWGMCVLYRDLLMTNLQICRIHRKIRRAFMQLGFPLAYPMCNLSAAIDSFPCEYYDKLSEALEQCIDQDCDLRNSMKRIAKELESIHLHRCAGVAQKVIKTLDDVIEPLHDVFTALSRKCGPDVEEIAKLEQEIDDLLVQMV